MLIIPAIDLKDGAVVRLVQGKFNKKVYSRDPAKVARHWVRQGAKFLHLVDLDGAFSGRPKNLNLVKDIVKAISVPEIA
ncbi:MAG: HisA/HisF-related TIM barrel protein, partial [Candidatus Omnitrophota bacterium]